MSHTISPVSAAKRVLRAFPFPKVGAEVSYGHIERFFRERGLPTSMFTSGLRYATQIGWIRRGEVETYILLPAGMEELSSHIPHVPATAWHSWAHP